MSRQDLPVALEMLLVEGAHFETLGERSGEHSLDTWKEQVLEALAEVSTGLPGHEPSENLRRKALKALGGIAPTADVVAKAIILNGFLRTAIKLVKR